MTRDVRIVLLVGLIFIFLFAAAGVLAISGVVDFTRLLTSWFSFQGI